MFNWFVGLSHGKLFNLVDAMTDGDAGQWRERFGRHGDFLAARAGTGQPASSAQDRLAAAFCYRAVLQYSDRMAEDFPKTLRQMETEFLEGARGLGVPLHPVEVPFEGKTLPGYFLEHDSTHQAARRDDRRRR